MLLRVHELKKSFPSPRKSLWRRGEEIVAVDGVSFGLEQGEIVGLVGASGSGKSTVGQLAIRLIEPTSGEIFLNGENLRALKGAKLREARRCVQMVFQDPLLSLNPRKTLLENVGEALLYRRMVKNKEELREQVATLLGQVGLQGSSLGSYPHQFSGGQQQRISIARALALRPALLICDEVTSALDLSIQAQILNLLYALKSEFNLSYLFISHDLMLVRHFCDRVLVMEKGRIVEEGTTEEVFREPKHPYTQSLLAARCVTHPRLRATLRE